jgi:hypothetical protein
LAQISLTSLTLRYTVLPRIYSRCCFFMHMSLLVQLEFGHARLMQSHVRECFPFWWFYKNTRHDKLLLCSAL